MMPIKKIFIYVINLTFALIMGYLYLGFAVKASVILIGCAILATFFAILNHQRNKSKLLIIFLDIALSFCVPVLFILIIMAIYGIMGIFQHNGPDIDFITSMFLSFFVSIMSGIYVACLPSLGDHQLLYT